MKLSLSEAEAEEVSSSWGLAVVVLSLWWGQKLRLQT
jgi:hypothetical protein